MAKEQTQALAVGLIGLIVVLYALSGGKTEQDCPDGQCPAVVESLADVPHSLRTRNWQSNGFGSCAHASTATLLRWQGRPEIADWWKATYSSGEYASRLIKRMESAGLRYAYTNQGSVEFLEWACRNRRGAGIFYFPSHAVNIVELNAREAVLLDNNRPEQYIRIPRSEFIVKWRTHYGGFAWTVCYDVPPPWPTW